MSLVNKLKGLASNIFNPRSTGGSSNPRSPASNVQTIDFRESPTGILGTDPLGFQTFSYPKDTQVNYENGHYMLFYVNVQEKSKYTYKGYDDAHFSTAKIKGISRNEERYNKLQALKRKVYETDDASGAGLGDSRTFGKKYFGERARDYVEGFIKKSDGTSNNKKGVNSLFNNTRRITDSVSMYLPPNVEESTSAKYDEASTGLAGFLLSSFGNEIKDMDAAAIARKLGGGLEGIGKELTFKAIGAAGELVGAEGLEALSKKAFGEASNPYMEVLFDQMSLRTFTYNFQFAPRNQEEAEEVQNIIQLFRFHMAPELRPNVNRYVGLPSQFDIHYMFLSKDGVASENNYYNRIATCVLTDCKVNYTPTGVKSFEDGGPVQTTMTLSFKEIELLTKDKIAQGY
jgi:hypothetical protein